MAKNAEVKKPDGQTRFSEFCKAKKIAADKIKWKFAADSKVKISIDKEDAVDGGWHLVTLGVMFALRELGVNDIDITLRSEGESLDIIVER